MALRAESGVKIANKTVLKIMHDLGTSLPNSRSLIAILFQDSKNVSIRKRPFNDLSRSIVRKTSCIFPRKAKYRQYKGGISEHRATRSYYEKFFVYVVPLKTTRLPQIPDTQLIHIYYHIVFYKTRKSGAVKEIRRNSLT